MTSENNGMFQMPVMPAYGGMGNGSWGMDGIGGWWILIMLILFGGWGNYGWGNNAGNGGVVADVQRGFDQSALTSGINGLQTGINGIQTSLCNGFAGVNQSISNGFAQAEIAANSRQMADMNQNFTMQSTFQNGLCETRLANANLMAAVAQEGATTRAASANDRQILMDKLSQIEMNDLKRDYEGQLRTMTGQLAAAQSEIATLRGDINRNSLAAQILANNEAQTTALEQYLAPVPRPAYVVQNPNCCGNGNGFGFGGCGGYAA